VTTTTVRQLLQDAQSAGAAVAAFNVITLEHAEGVIAGAEATGRGVILQVSENVVRYRRGALLPLSAALRSMAEGSNVPVGLHLDHVEDAALARRAPDAGYGSVMFDAGRLPYDENVATTAAVAEMLHRHEVFVEAELGYVGGKDSQVVSAHEPGVRTDPRQAAEFVAATGVDSLAVAVGSSHAMVERNADLDIDLLVRIREQVSVPLVLHGSSGVPDAGLTAAVRAGIAKVNIGTALNVAFTAAVREALKEPGSDPRKALAAGRDAIAEATVHLISVVSG